MVSSTKKTCIYKCKTARNCHHPQQVVKVGSELAGSIGCKTIVAAVEWRAHRWTLFCTLGKQVLHPYLWHRNQERSEEFHSSAKMKEPRNYCLFSVQGHYKLVQEAFVFPKEIHKVTITTLSVTRGSTKRSPRRVNMCWSSNDLHSLSSCSKVSRMQGDCLCQHVLIPAMQNSPGIWLRSIWHNRKRTLVNHSDMVNTWW